jgi:hypothetical protein
VAVPWLQIVRLVPSILDVSRELLKRTKRMPAATEEGELLTAAAPEELAPRVAALEDNERRQAELISQMAEQNAALARAVTALHSRYLRLVVATGVSGAVALVALILAARG